MRRDEQLSQSLRTTDLWGGKGKYRAEVIAAAGSPFKALVGMSFSGKERNRLFLSQSARQFVDLSAISGLDNIADSRVFACWDFDRDGWQDIAVVNSNAPLLSIYRNGLGAIDEARKAGRMIAVRFVGGSRTARPNEQFSCRDGYGAKVRVTAGDLKLLREHRCGEGMAGQNSTTMFIGIAGNESARSVEVEWLSGLKQTIEDVPAGTLLTVFENPDDAPDKSPFVSEPYVVPTTGTSSTLAAAAPAEDGTSGTLTLGDISAAASPESPNLRLYTTMATWCAVCKGHLPQVEQLRRDIDAQSLAIYGVPIDENDDASMLTAYVEENHPAYDLLKELPPEQRAHVQQLVVDKLKTDALPATILTDAEGRILLVTGGLPTISQIRELIDELPAVQ